MKKRISTIWMCASIAAGMNAQSDCGNLQLVTLEYAPFSDTSMQVIVLNDTEELFGYPQFSLIDLAGDTLLTEAVNFFGIAWDAPSIHGMDLRPGRELPESPFTGTLSLSYFTGDGLQACTFPIQEQPLCPQDDCVPFEVFLFTNAPIIDLVTDVFPWNITNEENEIVASGALQIDAMDQQQDLEQVCLPPGVYVLNMEQLGSDGTTFTIGVTQTGFLQNGPMATLIADGSVAMPFTYYPVCAQIGMAIEENARTAPLITVEDRMVHITDRNGSALGPIGIFDAAGRAIHSVDVRSSSISVDLNDRAAGLYLVVSIEAKWPAEKFMLAR